MLPPLGPHNIDPSRVIAAGRSTDDLSVPPVAYVRYGSPDRLMSTPLTPEVDAQVDAIVAAHNALSALSATTDPWRPGAHAEERRLAGGEQQVAVAECCPAADAFPVEGCEPAPGGAGMWCYAGATDIGALWLRWLVPVRS